MPDNPLDKLQDEYEELTRTIKRQNKLRNEGSDDYDYEKLDRANNRRNQVRREIKEAGGTPGARPKTGKSPTTGTGTNPPQPSLTPADSGSTVDQLQRQLKQLKGNPPHPGVRMEGGKVVGGTAKDLQEQLDWRGKVEKLEHELTGAQAEEAWATAGGPKGFTKAELDAIKGARAEVDGIQARLDVVNKKIAGLERKLAEAKGTLDEQKIEGGGPNAQSAAAIGVGAQINGLLRPLYKEQAAITQELNTALGKLTGIIKGRVRTQLEDSGVRVGMPKDKVGRATVEDAFLRRVFRRMGLPYAPAAAPGLLGGLTGTQSMVPSFNRGLLVVASILVALAIVFIVFLIVGSGTNNPTDAVVQTPQNITNQDATNGAADPSENDTNGLIGSDDETQDDAQNDVGGEPGIDTPATAVGVAVLYGCADVVHSPLGDFARSLSYFWAQLIIAGLGGPIPPGSMVTVDAGGLAPNTAPIEGAVANVPIPIDHYGTYAFSSITVTPPDDDLEWAVGEIKIDDVSVGSAEGPVDGCRPPAEVLDSDLDSLTSSLIAGSTGSLWIGDDEIAVDTEGSVLSELATFQAFLDEFDLAHQQGDAEQLLNTLDPAVIDRYGEDQCSTYLSGVVGSLSDVTVSQVSAEEWDYPIDGLTTALTDTYTLDIDLNLGGSPTQTEMHVRSTPQGITWFTDCGEPLP